MNAESIAKGSNMSIRIAVLIVAFFMLRSACGCSDGTFEVAQPLLVQIAPDIDSAVSEVEVDVDIDAADDTAIPVVDTNTTDAAPPVADTTPHLASTPGKVECASKSAAECAKYACDESSDCGGARCCATPDGKGSTCDCSGASMDGWTIMCQSTMLDCYGGKACVEDAAWPGHGECH